MAAATPQQQDEGKEVDGKLGRQEGCAEDPVVGEEHHVDDGTHVCAHGHEPCMSACKFAHVPVNDVETAGQDDVHADEHDDGLNIEVDVFPVGHEHDYADQRKKDHGDG